MKNLGGVSRLLLFSECLNPSVRISFLEDNQLAHRHINMRIYFPFSIQKQQKLFRIWDFFFFLMENVYIYQLKDQRKDRQIKRVRGEYLNWRENPQQLPVLLIFIKIIQNADTWGCERRGLGAGIPGVLTSL